MSAIGNDAPTQDFDLIDTPISESEAEAEFLKRFLPPDAEKPSGQAEDKRKKAPAQEEPSEESDDTPAEEETAEDAQEESSETEEAEEGEGEEERATADESAYVKVKVGEEEHEVSVKDLTRLYGQEASLTKKSMEVAETRKKLDTEVAQATAATATLLDRARQRFAPYAQIDFALAATQLPPDQYQALREEALAAHNDVQFLEKNLGGLMKQITDKKSADRLETARESLKTLSGLVDKGGIENWNEKLYDDIRAFAVTQGAPAETVNEIVDAWAIRLLHDAMLYQRGKSKVITKKVNKTPTKVTKTTVTPKGGPTQKANNADKAMMKLRKSGKEDDAVDVFMSRWAAAADDAE
jgi:hypothetical protein